MLPGSSPAFPWPAHPPRTCGHVYCLKQDFPPTVLSRRARGAGVTLHRNRGDQRLREWGADSERPLLSGEGKTDHSSPGAPGRPRRRRAAGGGQDHDGSGSCACISMATGSAGNRSSKSYSCAYRTSGKFRGGGYVVNGARRTGLASKGQTCSKSRTQGTHSSLQRSHLRGKCCFSSRCLFS